MGFLNARIRPYSLDPYSSDLEDARMRFILSVVALACFAIPAVGQQNRPAQRTSPYTDLFDAKTYTDASGAKLLYRLHVPKGYDASKKYPLVLFLHGAGGRGEDNLGQLVDARGNDATKWAAEEVQAKNPCFIVAPQCPANRKWVDMDWSAPKGTMPKEPTAELRMTMEVIRGIQKEYSIDPSRLYVTGLSMGGYGTWDLVCRHPELFAAAVPVCGGGDETQAERVKNLPIWCFHGANDKVVPTVRSRNMVEAIRTAGGDPKYTEYEGVGHDSWVKAYNEPDLHGWVFQQRK
jgi:predicted peptidase